MADFSLRSDQIDVEQIMKQIRTRIKEKRGVDYTDQEIRELASVKLERFLDPRAVRSDLLAAYRRQRPPVPLPSLPGPPENYAFEDVTIYESHRGPLRWIRKLLNPLLKLLFNPNPLIHVLNLQSKINDYTWQTMAAQFDRVGQRFVTRDELDTLNYEVLNNLVLELTKLGIENRNLRMRLESMGTRLDFDERRQRAFEGLAQFKPVAAPSAVPSQADGEDDDDGDGAEGAPGGAGDAGRPGKRRRRRRGRKRGPEGSPQGPQGQQAQPSAGSQQDRPASAPPSSDIPNTPSGGGSDQQ
jgi:hypothetical protein